MGCSLKFVFSIFIGDYLLVVILCFVVFNKTEWSLLEEDNIDLLSVDLYHC